MRIKEIITSIKYGPHFRTTKEGDVLYLKGNQFDDDYQLSSSSKSYVKVGENEQKHLLVEDDIILAAKGFRNFAWKYSKKEGACIASSLFYVIKLKSEIIHPDYFVMTINSPRIQHALKTIGLGVTIPAIPRNELLRIKITVPPMADQLKAVEIHNLLNQQISLERKILKRRIDIKNGLLNVLTEKS